MSPLAVRIAAGVLAVLALIALRGKRWAYFALILLGLAYFPAQAQFRVHAPLCTLTLPTAQTLLLSVQNYAFVALFAGFYWVSWVQFRNADRRGIWALPVTLLAGALVQVAQGATLAGRGHCRLVDLAPAVAGGLGAALLLAVWGRMTRKPAYVRLVKKGTKAAPAPSPTPAPRVVHPPPVMAPIPEPVTEERPQAPEPAARPAFATRLEPILGRVRTGLRSTWALIHARRRAVVLGAGALVLVGAGAFVFLRFSAPAPVAVEPPPPPPPEPPPPPARPLQAEVEGYYEPSYPFTVFDRRFVRVTLRPAPFVTFARLGSRQEVACEDARIGRDAVYLRCTIEPVGKITIDGRFPARYVSNRLDMPVLSALITVTSARGETVYRARDSFYWHVPSESR